MKPDFETLRRYIELLTGSPDSVVCWRLLPERPDEKARVTALEKAERKRRRESGDPHWKGYALRRNYTGSVADMRQTITELQAAGWAVFVVVNEGGHWGENIASIRAAFVDSDGVPVPEKWHKSPAFLSFHSPTRWHGYWPLIDCGLDGFEELQKRLAKHYGSDPGVHDLPRVLRAPGTIHWKGEPIRIELRELDGKHCAPIL